MPNQNKTRVILTDFGTSLDMRASKTINCSLDNHAVVCIFFVLTNWRTVKYHDSATKEDDETIINDCDRWIFLAIHCQRLKKTIMHFITHASPYKLL